VVIDVLFVRRDRLICVLGAFIGLVIGIKLVLFVSLDEMNLIMTGDTVGLPVLLMLFVMR